MAQLQTMFRIALRKETVKKEFGIHSLETTPMFHFQHAADKHNSTRRFLSIREIVQVLIVLLPMTITRCANRTDLLPTSRSTP